MARVTQQIIADRLGVSQITVSKALRGDKDISAASRELIERTAREMGYTPNLFARSLAEGKSRIVGILIPRLRGKYYSTLLETMEQGICKHNYIPVVLSESTPEMDQKNIELLRQYRAAGIIVLVHSQNYRELERINQDQIPSVLIGFSELQGKCNVVTDDQSGIASGVDYLYSKGHRGLCLVSLTQDDGRQPALELKERSFLTKVAELGCKAGILRLSKDGHQEAICRYLKEYPEYTAYFCLDDSLVFDAMDAIESTGKRIPEDISLMGHGDDIEHQDRMRIPLDVISHQPVEIGRLAVRYLLDQINGKPVPQKVEVPNFLIKRKSVKDISE